MNNFEIFLKNVTGAVGEYTISCDAECETPPCHQKMSVKGFKSIIDHREKEMIFGHKISLRLQRFKAIKKEDLDETFRIHPDRAYQDQESYCVCPYPYGLLYHQR
jgi:hypothetical protein